MLFKGSKGSLERAFKTSCRSHSGTRFLTGGLELKKHFQQSYNVWMLSNWRSIYWQLMPRQHRFVASYSSILKSSGMKQTGRIICTVNQKGCKGVNFPFTTPATAFTELDGIVFLSSRSPWCDHEFSSVDWRAFISEWSVDSSHAARFNSCGSVWNICVFGCLSILSVIF